MPLTPPARGSKAPNPTSQRALLYGLLRYLHPSKDLPWHHSIIKGFIDDSFNMHPIINLIMDAWGA